MKTKRIFFAIALVLVPGLTEACGSSPAEGAIRNIMTWITLFVLLLSLVSLIISIVLFSTSEKYKVSRKMKIWMAFSALLFVFDFIALVYLRASGNFLCSSGNF